MGGRRADLLEQCLSYFLEKGVAGASLRPLGEAVGSSARLLVYHFGSKEGLITAVMAEVQARIQASFQTAMAAPGRPARGGVMHRFWTWMTAPENLRHLRLLFEVQVLALQHPEDYGAYLEGTSSSWLDLIEQGLPPSRDRRAMATLCAAVMDGLLLETLSTGDLRRTTAALDLFEGLMKHRPPSPKPSS